MQKKNSFPVVFIHGFFGWGESDGLYKVVPYYGWFGTDVRKICRSLGFECCIPAVGPLGSAWDRACELYAQLTGTRVDYGKAHSEHCGHARYGRTYNTPLIPGWGSVDSDGTIKKINIIAHSYGGPTARIFLDLLVRGSDRERDVTPENELSDLFRGGHKNWVHSCTTLAATHEGTTLIDGLDKIGLKKPVTKLLFTASSFAGKSPLMKIWDMHLDQFGITKPYNSGDPIEFKVDNEAVSNALSHPDDICFDLMAVKESQEFARNFRPFPNIYYFSYCGCKSAQIPVMKKSIPKFGMFFNDVATSFLMGFYTNTDPSKGALIDTSWTPNDGQVNLISARAPLNEPQDDFTSLADCRPGIWYKMPVEDKDHHSFMGIGQRPDEYRNFIYDVLYRISNLDTVN